jgi:hypothetical protein
MQAMKKQRIKMTITKEDAGYSAHASVGDTFIATKGDNFEELKKNVLDAVRVSFPKGVSFDIKFTYDLESFFNFYKVINAKALSQRIGMNQSLLAQYIKGIKTPSPVQTKRILTGVQEIGKELAEARFVI